MKFKIKRMFIKNFDVLIPYIVYFTSVLLKILMINLLFNLKNKILLKYQTKRWKKIILFLFIINFLIFQYLYFPEYLLILAKLVLLSKLIFLLWFICYSYCYNLSLFICLTFYICWILSRILFVDKLEVFLFNEGKREMLLFVSLLIEVPP